MFTGIVQEIGQVRQSTLRRSTGSTGSADRRMEIHERKVKSWSSGVNLILQITPPPRSFHPAA